MPFFKPLKQKNTSIINTKPTLPLVLIIMDGYGISPIQEGNAVFQAKTPNLDYLQRHYPKTLVQASGNEVGLPYGEAGNSEVGHLNIGAGRIIYQPLLRVTRSLQEPGLDTNPEAKKIVAHLKKTKGALHLIGLVSAGGVHSHIEHVIQILTWAKKQSIKKIYLHIFTDGRDSPPAMAEAFMSDIDDQIKSLQLPAQVASISGRLYAMDRDNIWSRTQEAYRAIMGSATTAVSTHEAIKSAYAKGLNDEFLEPRTLVDDKDNPIGSPKDGDVLFFFNIRPDRSRQIVQSFSDNSFSHFSTKKLKNIKIVTLTEYDESFKKVRVVFPEPDITRSLGEVISENGLKQLRIAETQKYAHVTYFFNGGREKRFESEKRTLIPSYKVKNFSEKPEMSTAQITKKVLTSLDKKSFDVYVINFANADMVGHTGNFNATKKAIEIMDDNIGMVVKKVLELDGAVVITSDHGNAEEMLNFETGSSDTEHNIYPVPCMVIANHLKRKRPGQTFKEITMQPQGTLADVAPTILDLIKIKKPKEMTGVSLLKSIE